MIERDRFGESGVAEDLRPEMAFLAENPEAFGLVSDACPLTTKHLLIAANGHAAEGGGASPVYDAECRDAKGLLSFYGDLLPHDADTRSALLHAFGENNILREQPVSLFCAALTEVIALRVLNVQAQGLDYGETLALLNDELGWALHALRGRFEDLGQVQVIHDAAFQPSVGICRIREQGNGDYTAEIFAAGDFRVYLLDEQGMAPLWSAVTPTFAPDRGVGLTGRSVRLHHPAPFAVLLVSESICALNAAEYRSLRSDGGLIWRYRMRLEDYFLRLLTDCVREYEFGERAAHFFVGRSHGRDSASGALTILRDGISYETFHLQCQNRLSALGRQMELLPDGYDPERVKAPESRALTERRYLQGLLESRAELKDSLTNALRLQILRKIERGDTVAPPPPPPDVPDYLRLDPDEIRETVGRLDYENREDRLRVAENRKVLRESIAEHWITLRPVLIGGDETGDAAVRAYRESNDCIFGVCLDMNRRLAEMKERRQAEVDALRRLVTKSLEVIRAEGNDWVCGRAGQDSLDAWIAPLRDELPGRLGRMETDWREETERYRCLLTAYTAQRDDLFRRDILPQGGGFAARMEALQDGNLPDALWDGWRARLEGAPETAGFGEFLDALHRVSKGTGVLLARIRSRAVENRAARELANRTELRIAALRGAVYEDPDWGDEIIAVMDGAAKDEFRGALRRWEEACRLAEQQKEAFESYAALYGAYGG